MATRRQFTDDEKAALIKEWRASGKPLQTFSIEKEISRSVMGRWIQKGKDKPQKKAPTDGRRMKRYSDEVKAGAVARLKKGEKARQIADDIGTSDGMIYAWGKKAGFTVIRKGAAGSNGAESVNLKSAIVLLIQAERIMEAKGVKERGVSARISLALEQLGAR